MMRIILKKCWVIAPGRHLMIGVRFLGAEIEFTIDKVRREGVRALYRGIAERHPHIECIVCILVSI
jgi:hypothetical protein